MNFLGTTIEARRTFKLSRALPAGIVTGSIPDLGGGVLDSGSG